MLGTERTGVREVAAQGAWRADKYERGRLTTAIPALFATASSIDILARQRDDLHDEIALLKRQQRNTAHQTSQVALRIGISIICEEAITVGGRSTWSRSPSLTAALDIPLPIHSHSGSHCHCHSRSAGGGARLQAQDPRGHPPDAAV